MSEENQEVQTTQTDNASTENNQTPVQSAGPDLNISDLIGLKNILEVAIGRGAFKATEIEAVGKTFNKLNAFLEAIPKKEA